MECSRTDVVVDDTANGSNNTNKWNAQEQHCTVGRYDIGSNNTNKWNAQERVRSKSIY